MADLFPVQAAIVTALKSAPATYPVYDAVPPGAAKPYVVVGEWTAQTDLELDDADADTATVALHGWSAQNGKKEAHAIRAWMRAKLHHQTLSGTWACFEEFAEVFEESTAEGRLYHLVSRYRIRTN